MALPTSVQIVEVSPRDGLQNETRQIPTPVKIELINQLATTGLQVIEAASFVSPKWVPQLADGKEVLQGIQKAAGVRYPVLVPNLKGFELAKAAGAREVAVFTTSSELFSQKNTNCSVAESVERVKQVIDAAKQANMRVRVYLSCVLGCPYEGDMSADKVADLAAKVYAMGGDEISLGDTIGVGTPLKTDILLNAVTKYVPVEKLAVHFHDTYGQALANIHAALAHGIAIVDSSVSGIGGCPYAKGATGNVATEDVVYMLDGMNIKTGVDLAALIKVGRYISKELGRDSQSRVNRAAG